MIDFRTYFPTLTNSSYYSYMVGITIDKNGNNLAKSKNYLLFLLPLKPCLVNRYMAGVTIQEDKNNVNNLDCVRNICFFFYCSYLDR